DGRIGMLEIEGGEFALALMKDFAIAELFIEGEVVNEFDILHIHRQALEAVGDLSADRVTIDAAHLLEIGELSDFHPVAPYFPAQAPGPQGRAFPIVL